MDLRAEATSDWPAVRAVHLAAFGDHGDVVGNLVDDLRESVARGDGLSIVAEDGNDVVGHVMFHARATIVAACPTKVFRG